jgi:hypothetical protein
MSVIVPHLQIHKKIGNYLYFDDDHLYVVSNGVIRVLQDESKLGWSISMTTKKTILTSVTEPPNLDIINFVPFFLKKRKSIIFNTADQHLYQELKLKYPKKNVYFFEQESEIKIGLK